jgi:hypothetical protein
MAQPLSEDAATHAAQLLVQAALSLKYIRHIHLSVLTANRKTEPTIPYHWRCMNMFGVSYARHEVAEAEAWVVQAIRGGYRPFFNEGKRGAGFSIKETNDLVDAHCTGVAA